MKKKIYITLERESGNVKIKIKTPQDLENFFKTISGGETEQSQYWKDENGAGLHFYKINDEYAQKIKMVLDGERYFDNFGDGLINSGRTYNNCYNIAPLRTVGIGTKQAVLYSEKFEGASSLELEEYIKQLGLFTKQIWSALINKTKIKSVLTFEI